MHEVGMGSVSRKSIARELVLEELAAHRIKGGRSMLVDHLVDWLVDTKKLLRRTARNRIRTMTTNDPGRLHHHLRNDGSDDVLFLVADGKIRRYDPHRDPKPITCK